MKKKTNDGIFDVCSAGSSFALIRCALLFEHLIDTPFITRHKNRHLHQLFVYLFVYCFFSFYLLQCIYFFFLNYSFSYHLNWSMTAENKKIKKNEHPSQKPFDDAAMWFSSDHDHFLSKTIRWLFRCFYLHNFYFYPRNLFIAMYLCIYIFVCYSYLIFELWVFPMKSTECW